MLKHVALIVAVISMLLALSGAALTQGRDLIQGEIDQLIASHPYRLGIIRVQPRFVVATSYDSNVFSNSELVLSDYYTSIAPGGGFGLKLGRRAFFTLDEEINILFYQRQTELNDVFNTTSGRFGIGSRRLLAEVGGSYVRRDARVNNEFDQPAQQRFSSLNGRFSISLREHTLLRLLGSISQSKYRFISDTVTDLPLPPDTRTTEYGASLEQNIGIQTDLALDVTRGKIKFLSFSQDLITDNTANYWRLIGGLSFRGVKVAGRAKVGYGRTESIGINPNTFTDLLIDADVDYRLAPHLAIGTFLQRQRTVSALLQNNFRITTEGGVRGCIPLVKAFFIDGKLAFGKNDYGSNFVFGGQPVTKDNYVRVEAGTNFVLPKNFVLRVGTTYQNRQSNIDILTRDRFTFNIGIALEARKGEARRQAGGCSPVAVY
jgi:hypothetical protein